MKSYHAAYLSDLSSFRLSLISMQHGLVDQHFKIYEEIKKLLEWIVSKEHFFYCEILLLLEKWKKVMASDKKYFE